MLQSAFLGTALPARAPVAARPSPQRTCTPQAVSGHGTGAAASALEQASHCRRRRRRPPASRRLPRLLTAP